MNTFIAGTKPKLENDNLIAPKMTKNVKPKQPMAKSNIKRTNRLYTNTTQIVRRQFNPILFNEDYQPAYARPTIATTARSVCIAKTMAAKVLAKTKSKPKDPERPSAGQSIKPEKLKEQPQTKEELPKELKEQIGIQTNETEILNPELVVGDVKLLTPSPAIVTSIENTRKEKRKRAELSARRKYDMLDERKSAHLTELKEFLETATIKKSSSSNKHATPATKIQIINKNRIENELDTQMKPSTRKTYSNMSIKTRIQQKEHELLSLFDNVERI